MNPIKISVRGLEVPSFKNTKMIARGRLITDPKKQKKMDAITASIESQLRSIIHQQGKATLTGPLPLSLIASLMPLDDSRQWIVNLSVQWQPTDKGHEGADVTIEKL